MIRSLRQHYGSLEGATVVEIGTGWQPTIPLLLYLAGSRVILTDVERLMDFSTVVSSIAFLASQHEWVACRLNMEPGDITDALCRGLGRDFSSLLANLRFEYRAPGDIRSLPPGRADIVYSRAVLEHIPAAALDGLIADCRAVLSPNGLMMHIIDNSDHWQHTDRRLSRINFLRYHESTWRLINSSGQIYQNRLRHSDYVALMVSAGYEIRYERAETDPGARLDALRMPLAPRFREHTPDDLAALTSHILCAPV
ncbi:class I SAM-dependent methyltransferase [Salinisphaera sp. SPP-AMP-43]|uniref:class I SAM-dependent methyltransferase n=1 Tax=Salinisphaera sp. SPP-AMP-43 TaxID=3121288 RepID=UPI003C6DE0FC